MNNLKPKNYRKVKEEFLLKLSEFEEKDFYIGKFIEVTKEEIENGNYKNIGITLENEKVIFEKEILPKKSIGRYSKLNVVGKTITRKDLRKVSKQIVRELPNFGDWSKGSHDASYYRDVWQKEFLPPKGLTINTELVTKKNEDNVESFIFKIYVSEVLSKESDTLKEDILYVINLFRENVGKEDVITSEINYQEYLNSINVEWEILPIGNKKKEELYGLVTKKYKNLPDEMEKVIQDRYEFLYDLKPQSFISGASGFNRYIGAQFSSNLVVFENLKYGNAVYIMFQNWEELSRLSRVDLLKKKTNEFERVVHRKNWKNKVTKVIRSNI